MKIGTVPNGCRVMWFEVHFVKERGNVLKAALSDGRTLDLECKFAEEKGMSLAQVDCVLSGLIIEMCRDTSTAGLEDVL